MLQRTARIDGFMTAIGALATLVAAGMPLGEASAQVRSQAKVSVNFVDATAAVFGERGSGAPRGDCPDTISGHSTSVFTPGQPGDFFAQAGFAQSEIAAASFTIPAAAFPIKVNVSEIIFATSGATVPTTTQWSLLVWDGFPGTGTLVADHSSDGVITPHLTMQPGTNATILQVAVDPGDPEQIVVSDNGGTHTFTVGFRIDRHNQQTQDPCFIAPPSCCNAFPCTDTSGLASPTGNWLFGVNCGPFGCPANGGWASFAQLPTFCRPSGDWAIRVTWESVNCTPTAGGCCLPSGFCEIRTPSSCAADGGSYRGDGTTCQGANCPQPTQACCFPSTGGCLNLSPANCSGAGGTPAGPGTSCATYVCFPMGACCLPNGSCIGPVSPESCQGQGGVFQGNATNCGSVNCPLPMGACCFSTGFCLRLTQTDCATAGGTYGGDGSDCAAGCTEPCACDWNDSGSLNSQDYFDFLGAFFGGSADFNEDGSTNSQDYFDFLGCFFAGC